MTSTIRARELLSIIFDEEVKVAGCSSCRKSYSSSKCNSCKPCDPCPPPPCTPCPPVCPSITGSVGFTVANAAGTITATLTSQSSFPAIVSATLTQAPPPSASGLGILLSIDPNAILLPRSKCNPCSPCSTCCYQFNVTGVAVGANPAVTVNSITENCTSAALTIGIPVPVAPDTTFTGMITYVANPIPCYSGSRVRTFVLTA